MIPPSIRWRLPLSYAAIALLTTLALGAVLLAPLRRYYRQQELDYLTGNAQAISQTLAPLLEAELPLEAIRTQLDSYAFLSQTRVRLLDDKQVVLADSGSPEVRHDVLALALDVEVEEEGAPQTITHTIEPAIRGRDYTSFILIKATRIDGTPLQDVLGGSNVEVSVQEFKEQGQGEAVSLKKTITVTGTHPLEIEQTVRQELGLPESPVFGFISTLPAVGTPYGFGFNVAQASPDRRSDQRAIQPIFNSDEQLVGYIELSEGPAYGDQILTRVAWGWGLASGIAVLLAGVVGWGISRRLSRPLTALTEVTGRMAAGDLSRRAQVTGRDEIGRLAASFNEMAVQVEQTVQTLRRFVADAAHELHTPLTALRTNLELVAGSGDEAARRDFMARAQSQVNRLERLTRDLLDLSRLETGAVEANHAPINLVALTQELGELYASQAEQIGLNFCLEVPQEVMTVAGNPAQLRQALSNLLDNALKFTPTGGTIRLGLRREDAWAEVWLEDTGIGIPPADVPQLFSRFHRGRNAVDYPGSGLGLAIVKVIAEGHGGQVTVNNTLSGACFRLRLPLLAGHENQ